MGREERRVQGLDYLKSYSPWSHVSSTVGLVTKLPQALFCFPAHEPQQQFDYYSLIVFFHFLKSCLKCHITCGVNKTDRPNTAPTVRAICTFAVYFSVFRPFRRLLFMKGISYCVIRRKLEPLDSAKANFRGHRSA